jgi:hypothetical protein
MIASCREVKPELKILDSGVQVACHDVVTGLGLAVGSKNNSLI